MAASGLSPRASSALPPSAITIRIDTTGHAPNARFVTVPDLLEQAVMVFGHGLVRHLAPTRPA